MHNDKVPIIYDINEATRTGIYVLTENEFYDISTSKYLNVIVNIATNNDTLSSALVIGSKGLIKEYLRENDEWVLCYEEYQTSTHGIRMGEIYTPGDDIVRARRLVNGVWQKVGHPVFGEDVAKAKRAKELANKAQMDEEQFNAILLAVKELF